MKMYSVVGNNKKVTMPDNACRLKVVGNNCMVLVSVNHGEIEVIGNNCKVNVGDNYGSINIVGGNGVVTVEKRWRGDRVLLIGRNCHVITEGKKTSNTPEQQLSPFSKNLDEAIESLFSFVMR